MINRFIGALLLVAGTTIGAAMLALPITTGLVGFIPSLILLTVIWLFMMLTAYYLLEVNLRLKGESNLISMMHKTLGRKGEIASWVIYLVLLYSILAAYLMGCAQIMESIFPGDLPPWAWPSLAFALFASIVYFGTGTVDGINRILMVVMLVSFITIMVVGLPHISVELLDHVDMGYVLPSFSVVLTTFGFHIIIPTLTTYLDHRVQLLKWAIFIGSLLPFLVYILWQLLVMGVVPVTTLAVAKQAAEQATPYLNNILQSPLITVGANTFAAAAIITSLLGVALSLTDFLADGLKVKKEGKGKLLIILLTFVPPLLFALLYPHGFLLALKYAGICIVLLLALFPALMAWYERYHPDRGMVKSTFQVMGGKGLLMTTIVLSLVLLILEVFS